MTRRDLPHQRHCELRFYTEMSRFTRARHVREREIRGRSKRSSRSRTRRRFDGFSPTALTGCCFLTGANQAKLPRHVVRREIDATRDSLSSGIDTTRDNDEESAIVGIRTFEISIVHLKRRPFDDPTTNWVKRILDSRILRTVKFLRLYAPRSIAVTVKIDY